MLRIMKQKYWSSNSSWNKDIGQREIRLRAYIKIIFFKFLQVKELARRFPLFSNHNHVKNFVQIIKKFWIRNQVDTVGDINVWESPGKDEDIAPIHKLAWLFS